MVTPVKTCGADTLTLLDSGAVLNLTSTELYEKWHLNLKDTRKTITFADGSNSGCLGKFSVVQISFGTLTAHVDLIKVKNGPLVLIIRSTNLRNLGGIVDCGNLFLDLQVSD